MKKITDLKKTFSTILKPCSPYNFDATIYKPSHFPFSDNEWEKLAFHYFWEDIFWQRKTRHIIWLEKEIRL